MKVRSRRKYWIAIVFLVIVVGIPTQVFAKPTHNANSQLSPSLTASTTKAAQNQPVGIINTGALNLRHGPGLSFGIVTVAYQGQAVTLLGRYVGNNWVKIRLNNGVEGWVNSYYINSGVPISSLPALDPTTDPPKPVQPIAPLISVATGALNMRSGPGISYNILTVLRWGDPLAATGRNSDGTWLFVRNNSGTEGWVNASYLYIGISIMDLPVIGAITPDASATVVIGSVNVRKGPGGQYDSIAVLNQGKSVPATGRSAAAQWVQVRLDNGEHGWVSITALQLNVSIYSLPVMDVEAPPNSAVVNTGALNVRYGPGTSFGAFTVVHQGNVVTLVGRALYSSWVQIRLSTGAVGWVNSYYLTSRTSIDTLPVTWP